MEMELGTLSDIVVALMAVAALIVSVYTYRLSVRTHRLSADTHRLQQQQTVPSLKVSSDTRIERRLPPTIYSCRVVNDGHVPVEIRTLRMVLNDERTLPMPATDEEILPHLWENEKMIPVGPTVLQPAESVRFATSEDRMEFALKRAGFAGSTWFKVAVIDALDNSYMVDEFALLGEPEPEP